MLPDAAHVLIERNRELQERLEEAEETLRALRNGEVDAVVVEGPEGDRVYTLKGAGDAYKLMVQEMAEGAVTLALDGLILFANQQFASLLGLPLEQVIGSPFQKLVAEEDAGLFAALLSGGNGARSEVRLRGAGPAPVPVYLSASTLVSDGGEFVCCVVTDLTGQKRSEEIVASERLARSILEQASGAILVVDPDGIIIRASRAAESMAGAAVLLKPFDSVFPLLTVPGSRDFRFEDMLSRIREGGGISALETTARTPRNGTLDLVVNAALLSGAAGEPLGCVVVLHDISSLKNAQKALAESEERFRAAFANAAIGFAMTTPDGRFLDANSAFCALTGYTREELQAFAFPQLMHPDDLAENTDRLRRMRDGEFPDFVIENRYVRKDGAAVWVRKSVSVVRSADGSPRWILALVEDVGERRRQEAALRESEQRFRSLFESSLDAVLLTIADGSVEAANPAACALFGMSEEEICRAGRAGLVSKSDVPALQAAFEMRRSSGRARFDLKFVRKDGSEFDGEVSSVLTDEAGRAFVIIRDITQRKKHEEALRLSEERERARAAELEAVMDAAPVAVWIAHDPECRRITGNRYADDVVMRAERGSNISATAPAGEAAVSYTIRSGGVEVPPASLPAQAAAATGQPVKEQELELVFPGGRSVHVLMSAVPLFDHEGKVRGSVAAGIDITRRKEAEEALRQSEVRYRTLHETLRDAFVRVAMDGRILEFNDAFCQMLGYTPDELGALTYVDLTPARWQAEEAAIVRDQILPRGYSDVYQKEYRRKDGTVFPVELRTILLRDATGRPDSMWGIIRDISDRKRAEEALRRSNEDLQQFAYVASHDLQEPLRTITSYSKLLERRLGDKLDSDTRDFVAMIGDAARRMHALVTDLLTYSRVEHTRREEVAVDMNAVAALAVSNLAQSIRDTGAVVEYDPMPEVRSDHGACTQVLQNLLGNAIKYRSAAPPRIRISGRAEGAECLFSITDNGIGIDARYHDRIFGLFKRLHPASEYPGTGIGLAICKKIVERQGGRIWVESQPGAGSTFHFTLPAAGREK